MDREKYALSARDASEVLPFTLALHPALTNRRGRRRAGALVLRLLLVLCLAALMAGVEQHGVSATVQAQTATCFAFVLCQSCH